MMQKRKRGRGKEKRAFLQKVPSPPNSKRAGRERRWLAFNDGCLQGIKHSEVVFVRSVPHRSFARSSVAVFTVSRAMGLGAGLTALILIVLLLAGCQMTSAQKGGGSKSLITRPGHTNAVTLTQSENPKEPSKQTVQSEQTIEYVLPAGTVLSAECGVRGAELEQRGRGGVGSEALRQTLSDGRSRIEPGGARPLIILEKPIPVRVISKDRTETSIGGAQKDTVREWAGKAASVQPVMWAGVIMMTIVAGILVYFGWWTKAALAIGIGLAMVVVAATLPGHGTLILLGGLGTFAVIALLVLYAYHKGQLDQDKNGIPDFLEAKPAVAGPAHK